MATPVTDRFDRRLRPIEIISAVNMALLIGTLAAVILQG